MKTIKQQVEECLKRFPEARNDDKFLIPCVWALFYPHLLFNNGDGRKSVVLNDIMKLPSTETIRRVRQKFQSEGLYQASKETQLKREENEERMRTEMVKPSSNMLV